MLFQEQMVARQATFEKEENMEMTYPVGVVIW